MSYNGVAMRKFIRNFNDEVNGKFYSCPLIRLPEVYLNMAEAMNELNKAEVRDEFGNTAYDYLNKTRLRAGMPAISATDVPAGKPLREAYYAKEPLNSAMKKYVISIWYVGNAQIYLPDNCHV